MTKTTSRLSWHPIAMYLLSAIISATLISSCNKSNEIKSNSQQPFSYSSEVLDKWMTLQLRLMRNATGIANHALTRHFAYAGIAALESLAPGLPAHSKSSTKWNGLTGIPSASHPAAYYYPANVNAA